MDANAYALEVTPPTQSLGVLIRKAAWLGNGKPPAIRSAPASVTVAIGGQSILEEIDEASFLAAKTDRHRREPTWRRARHRRRRPTPSKAGATTS